MRESTAGKDLQLLPGPSQARECTVWTDLERRALHSGVLHQEEAAIALPKILSLKAEGL